MTDSFSPKPISASRIMLSQLMHPEHANLLGHVHGGWVMKLVDEAGALACMRHSQRKVVTVAIDSLVFRQPIRELLARGTQVRTRAGGGVVAIAGGGWSALEVRLRGK